MPYNIKGSQEKKCQEYVFCQVVLPSNALEYTMCCFWLNFYFEVSFFPKHMIGDLKEEVLETSSGKEGGPKTFSEIWSLLWIVKHLDAIIFCVFWPKKGYTCSFLLVLGKWDPAICQHVLDTVLLRGRGLD